MNSHSAELFQQAQNIFPGGVNSPVRAFGSVEGTPIFIKQGKGALVWDEDGNEYIDFCGSWGPLIHGHAHEAVVEAIVNAAQNGSSFGAPTKVENDLGGLIRQNVPFLESIRMVNSGTEAVMSAIRLARGFTGRNKIIKFEGCYHGHVDSMLVKAGSGLATQGTSSSAGVPESFVSETVVIPLDDEQAVATAFDKHKNEIAAIIIEPVPANNGLLIQRKEFLQKLRELCDEHNALLIFDEVINGFRIGFQGAAGHYGITPDLATYGKIIGGGLPVGMYGGRKDIMDHIAPLGPVYQAGTLSGNPMAMAAGIAQLRLCLEDGFYPTLEKRTAVFCQQINDQAKAHGWQFRMIHIGSIFWMDFSTGDPIRKADQIGAEGIATFGKLHRYLLDNGVYMGPSGYEVGFINSAHTDQQLAHAAATIVKGLDFVF